VLFSLLAAPRAETRLGYKNQEVIDLVAQGQFEADPARRQEIYVQTQKLILGDAINAILGYPSRIDWR